MDKTGILKIIDELYDDVQSLREDGETDLRTVLHFIAIARREIQLELGEE